MAFGTFLAANEGGRRLQLTRPRQMPLFEHIGRDGQNDNNRRDDSGYFPVSHNILDRIP